MHNNIFCKYVDCGGEAGHAGEAGDKDGDAEKPPGDNMISLRDKGGYQPVGELQSNTGHLSYGKHSIGDDPAKEGGCQLCHQDCDTQDPLQICLITLITDCYTCSTVLCIAIWPPPPP